MLVDETSADISEMLANISETLADISGSLDFSVPSNVGQFFEKNVIF